MLVGPALDHLTFAEVIGAFLATGLLMMALGATGWVRRAMQAIPMPIVMGMVAGVFLHSGSTGCAPSESDFWIAGADDGGVPAGERRPGRWLRACRR